MVRRLARLTEDPTDYPHLNPLIGTSNLQRIDDNLERWRVLPSAGIEQATSALKQYEPATRQRVPTERRCPGLSLVMVKRLRLARPVFHP